MSRLALWSVSVTVVFCFLGLPGQAGAERKNWALLVATARYWESYRFQANICHAYQMLHKAGIPDSRIVVMMYDDIADSKLNPYPGNVINKPNGTNVYPGVLKDYTGMDVNLKVFLAVLKGDKDTVRRLVKREGKVIESGPEDHVFVYVSGQGGWGLVNMPYMPYLTAPQLNAALKSMYNKKKYAKMVFYLASSGSATMFQGHLPSDINVYATTATGWIGSSWPCYHDDKRQAYLGDYYSVAWLEDSDAANLRNRTFEEQYRTVKAAVKKSNVGRFGDLSIGKLVLESFFGAGEQGEGREESETDSKTPATEDSGDKAKIENPRLMKMELKQTNNIISAPNDDEQSNRIN